MKKYYLTDDKTGEYHEVLEDTPIRYTDENLQWHVTFVKNMTDDYYVDLEAYINNRWKRVYASNPPQVFEVQVTMVCTPSFDCYEFKKDLEATLRKQDDVLKSEVSVTKQKD